MAWSSDAVDAGLASEQTPLLGAGADISSPVTATTTTTTSSSSGAGLLDANDPNLTVRQKIYLVLEGRHGAIGAAYEKITIVLILASIMAFVIGSLFDPVYNADADYLDMCGKVCDAIFFGQNSDNGELLRNISSVVLCCESLPLLILLLLSEFNPFSIFPTFPIHQDSVSLASGSLPHRFWK